MPTGGYSSSISSRLAAEPPGERHAAGLEADQRELVEAVVALDDLVGHPPERPVHVVGVHHPGPGHENAPVGGRGPALAFGHRPGRLLVRAGLTGPASRSAGEGSRARGHGRVAVNVNWRWLIGVSGVEDGATTGSPSLGA